ncbi:MAG: UTP--glucose-1-phosphate uridylyltransferase GalU [Helicobacteraceae bacterium]|nr:UTP--glucose-1-phosphate uridylyltransferase GalU [Helicobacteraceae bacterium]
MINKCLFPAAGYGTRFLPATKAIPKEMLPVNTKPLIQYGVEEALNAKCNTMAIVTGRGKRAIEDHFDISYELEHQLKSAKKEHLLNDIRDIINACSFTYIRQNEMKGLGHAILTGQKLVGNEPFGVILADDLCINTRKGVLAQMVELYDKYKCSIIAIQEVEKENLSKYGVIDASEIDSGIFRVKDMVEKPDIESAPSNLAVIGRYILTPDIFEILETTSPDKKGEIQITDALKVQAKKGNVIAYKFEGIRYDCGSIEGFVKANTDLFNNSGK